ncbi:MAG: UDP-N-acetylmuramate--L-alanine ligase [Clostridiales bacterium]|nr:UDP-N-acetylmuramate--L-alanine ligase [Clostridiales bacterium]
MDLQIPGLSEIKKVHFTGIGGISMSGLAEILKSRGCEISGSDLKLSPLTGKLSALGIKIFEGHSEANIDDADIVVYTAAVKQDNPELTGAVSRGIPIIERATLLGSIMDKYPYSVAVSGTHGKTTTSSMIASILIEEGLNPTIHLGGELPKIGGTTYIGSEDYFVAEACEYCGSFLKFNPYLSLILNIEYDHVDCFKTLNDVSDVFRKFASQTRENGAVILCRDDSGAASLVKAPELAGKKVITYGIKDKKGDWTIDELIFDKAGCPSFNVYYKNSLYCQFHIGVPGLHNASNSLAAIAAGHFLGCSAKAAKVALETFTNSKRRFEVKGIRNDIRIIDDYAHHPTEIRATLAAASNIKAGRTFCVFQPHTYSRTKALLDEFSVSFSDADMVIITDIYAAREKDTGEIHSSMLSEKIKSTGKSAIYIKDFNEIANWLSKNTEAGDIVLTMGAGDVFKIGEKFLSVPSMKQL